MYLIPLLQSMKYFYLGYTWGIFPKTFPRISSVPEGLKICFKTNSGNDFFKLYKTTSACLKSVDFGGYHLLKLIYNLLSDSVKSKKRIECFSSVLS